MKIKRLVKTLALFLCCSMMYSVAACNSSISDATVTSEPTAITVVVENTEETTPFDPTDEVVSEYELEEEHDEELPYDTYDESTTMYGARELTYYDGFDLTAIAAGKITIGESYEVVGETPTSYAISIDDEVYRIAKLALSSDVVEVEEDVDEEVNEEPIETLPNGSEATTPEPTRNPLNTATPTPRPSTSGGDRPAAQPTSAPIAQIGCPTHGETCLRCRDNVIGQDIWACQQARRVSGYADISFTMGLNDENGVYYEVPASYSNIEVNWNTGASPQISTSGDADWCNRVNNDYPNWFWQSSATITRTYNITWSDGVVTSSSERYTLY